MVLDPKEKSPEEEAFTFGTNFAEKINIRHKDRRINRIAFALVFKFFFSHLAICSHYLYKITVVRMVSVLFFVQLVMRDQRGANYKKEKT